MGYSRRDVLKGVGAAGMAAVAGCLGGDNCGRRPGSGVAPANDVPDDFVAYLESTEERQHENFRVVNEEAQEREVGGRPMVEEPLYNAESFGWNFYEGGSLESGDKGEWLDMVHNAIPQDVGISGVYEELTDVIEEEYSTNFLSAEGGGQLNQSTDGTMRGYADDDGAVGQQTVGENALSEAGGAEVEQDYDLLTGVRVHEDSPYADIGDVAQNEEARTHFAYGLAVLANGILALGVRKHRHPEEADRYRAFEDSINGIECQVEGTDGYGMRAFVPHEGVEYFFDAFGETEQQEDKEQWEVHNELFSYMREHADCYRE